MNIEHNPLENRKPAQERLDIKFQIANPDEWQKCKELRLISITGPEARMMGLTPERQAEEISKTEQGWRSETNSSEMFSVLAYHGSKAVGLGRTKEVGKGIWRLRNDYVIPEFRKMGIQPKMLALRLDEIIKRGGVKAIATIRTDNPRSISSVEKLGFQKIGLLKRVIQLGRSAFEWHVFELDLINSSVVEKINEVLKEN